MRYRSALGKAATQVFLILACLGAAFPLGWVVLTSLKNTRDATAQASDAFSFVPTMSNYTTVLASASFRHAALISVLVTVSATVVATLAATLGGYAFARLPFPGRRTLASVMVIVQVIPAVVLVIPLYRMVSALGLYDQWFVIAAVMTGLAIPFATWLMLAFFRSSPIEIEEAALIDGASRFQLFRHILIPIVAPGIATAGIFTAIAVWNTFLIPVVLGQTRAQTLTVYIAQFVTFQGIKWGPLCATAVLVLAPIVLFVLVMQRPLVKGLTAGSLKS
jgi:ABC-type glycerol-3-phosphate transport system permease component